MKTILVAVDFSPVSRRVLAEARALARALPARLAVVHAVAPPFMPAQYPEATAVDFPAVTEELRRGAEAQLKRMVRPLVRAGLKVTAHLLNGGPAAEISRMARKLRPAYLLIGSHGHGAFYHWVVGSTTSAVMRDARCPVIVVGAQPRERRR